MLSRPGYDINIEYNTVYSVSPEVPARPRVGSPDGRRPEGDPTCGRAGIEGDAEYTRRTRRTRNAFDLFYGSPGRTVKYGPVRNTVIECYRGPVFGGAALVGWSPGRRYNFEAVMLQGVGRNRDQKKGALPYPPTVFGCTALVGWSPGRRYNFEAFRHRFSRQWQYFPLSRRRCRDASIHTAKKSDRTEHRVWLLSGTPAELSADNFGVVGRKFHDSGTTLSGILSRRRFSVGVPLSAVSAVAKSIV
ncbi:hypothetical protein Bbelb_304280 [Branchiostoma belcheri]|nr:hypothetical protein Bbelb_304280 [Branchiostoma belcheri]